MQKLERLTTQYVRISLKKLRRNIRTIWLATNK